VSRTCRPPSGSFTLAEDGVVVRRGTVYELTSALQSSGQLSVSMYESPLVLVGWLQAYFGNYGRERPDVGTHTCAAATMRNWFGVGLYPGIARWGTVVGLSTSCSALPYADYGSSHRVVSQSLSVLEATAARVRVSFAARIEGAAASPAAGHVLDLSLAFDLCIDSTPDSSGHYRLRACP
jgi:hypothetical protein